MKTIYTTIFLLLTVISVQSQTPVLSLFDDWGELPGAYHKDLNNEYDRYVGTWKYEENGKLLMIVLQKKTMVYNPHSNIYADILVGEYKYFENGIERINTLSNLSIANLDLYDYNISSSIIRNRNLPASERGLTFNFVDPQRDYLEVTMGVQYIPFDGNIPAKIRISFRQSASDVPNENSPTQIRIPMQDYVLTKVN